MHIGERYDGEGIAILDMTRYSDIDLGFKDSLKVRESSDGELQH